jgi:hypothetical protein
MTSTVSPIAAAVSTSPHGLAAAQASPAAGAPPDRVALAEDGGAPLLTAGVAAAALAQVIPGVVEAEGLTGALTAVTIGARAFAAGNVGKTVVPMMSGALGAYGKTLFDDATAHQPAMQLVHEAATAVDGFVHQTLGIPNGSK